MLSDPTPEFAIEIVVTALDDIDPKERVDKGAGNVITIGAAIHVNV